MAVDGGGGGTNSSIVVILYADERYLKEETEAFLKILSQPTTVIRLLCPTSNITARDATPSPPKIQSTNLP
jgi:hypothetical protein